MDLFTANTMEKRFQRMTEAVKPFSTRALTHDKDGTFPVENFQELKAIGYHAVTLPTTHGGLGISLYEMLRHQEIIATRDGSTALSIGWHVGLVKHLGENNVWDDAVFAAVAKDVKEKGALINNAATERATGSPTRGGRPETTAKKAGSGWIISGRKTFTTLSPILNYFVVSASIDGTEDVGNFLIRRELPGVKIDETWDSIAMRGTGSHDLVLDNVPVDEEALVEVTTNKKRKPAGWLLHIPACYLGIAEAAKREAVKFATTYAPNSIKGTISELPMVKQKIGEMELLLLEARHFLFSVAKKWDAGDEALRNSMGPELGAAKMSVVNKAIRIVDLAMRVVGAHSLSEKSPLQLYYRDVRAGLHNPPMDDMTIMQLADKAIIDQTSAPDSN